MKRNKIYLFMVCGFMSLLAISCVDDKGNYEYEDVAKVMPATVSGISDTTIIINTKLKIVPDVQNVNKDWTYCWYAISITSFGQPVKTILSQSRDLDAVITLDAGNYYLDFEVRDEKHDVYLRKEVKLVVTGTEVNAGWYVLKDIDGETDFDYIKTNGVFYPDLMLNNVIPRGRLKGQAAQIVYQTGNYRHEIKDPEGKTTILNNLKVFYIVSSQDLKVLNANTLFKLKDYEDVFYGVPENRMPQSVEIPTYAMGSAYLVNGGKLHTIYGMTANVGKFSAAKVGFYSLHKDMFGTFSSVLCFDMESCTFYSSASSGSTLDRFSEENPNAANPIGVSPTNMNASMLNLLLRPSTGTLLSALGCAVMKHKSKEEYYLAGINFNRTAYPFTSYNTIPAGCKMPLANVKAAPYAGSFIYFGDGNKLCVYKDAPGLAVREEVLKTFPEGETVAYLKNEYAYGEFNYLIAVTNSSKGWKMYAYNIEGMGNPELEDNPVFVYSGTGNARYVLYRGQ